MKKPVYMWRDQYGYTYHARTLKELKKEVCPYTKYPKTDIMYRDKKDGSTVRVGYVISHHWLTQYLPVEKDI